MRSGFITYRHSVLLLALVAAGCSGSDFTNKDAWFAKPMNMFETPSFSTSNSAGGRTQQVARAVGPEDFVDASGSCAAAASASVQSPDGTPAPVGAPTVVGGVALGMTECEVVQRAGRPERIEIGGDGGARIATMTYTQGERAGIYRFNGGRLQTMDRIAEAPKPAKPARPAPKKKPANRPA